MSTTPNAIAGTQAPVEPEEPLEQPIEPVEPGESIDAVESEAPAVEGEVVGDPETPVEAPEVEPAPVADLTAVDPQQKKSDVQKRIDSLTRRRYNLETQNTQLQNELDELKRQQVQPSQPVAQAPQQIQIDPAQLGMPARPMKEQYETNDAFLENLAIWQAVYEVRRQTVVQRQYEQRNQAIAVQNSAIATWSAAVEKAREKYDDFDEVVGTEARIPQAAYIAIVDSPLGTEIAYHLGKHPETVRTLNQLTSAPAIMREIGKIEAQLSGSVVSPAPGAVKPAAKQAIPAVAVPAVKPKPKTSQPITPVGTSRPVMAGAPASSVDPSKMSYREYKKWREDNGANNRRR